MRAERNFTRFAVPVESPLPARHLIAKPINGHIIEAIPFVPEQDDHPALKARYAGHWVIIERDPSTGRVREATGLYADPLAAYYAYWHATEDEPIAWEAWVEPVWSASVSEAA